MASTIAVPVGRRGKSFLHVGLSLLVAAIVLVGFWPGYYGSLLAGASVNRPVVVHVHAVVFTGWLVLYTAQAVLAARGRIREHLRLGRIGAWYGGVLIAVGLYTAIVRSAAQPTGEREILLWVTLLDMALFSGFFAAALWFRRKPHLHKRLMTVAAVSLAIASVARLTFLPAAPVGAFVRFILWSVPVLIGIAHDARHSSTRLHPVYLAALACFAVRIWSPPLVARTQQWEALTAWLLGPIV